jgi:hypothetical protein
MAEAHSQAGSQATNRGGLLFRKPKRITITVPDQIYRTLQERSTREGRSISNLAAYLLERAVASEKQSEQAIAEGPVPQQIPVAADRRLIT